MTREQDRITATVIRTAEGEPIPAASVQHPFKLTATHTGGRFGLEEFLVPPATLGARPHIHWAHDEYFYVLDGELIVATDVGEVTLVVGDVAHAPRGSIHGFRNGSEHEVTKALCMYTPPGYEQYFRDVHDAVKAGSDLTVDLLKDLRSRYETESL